MHVPVLSQSCPNSPSECQTLAGVCWSWWTAWNEAGCRCRYLAIVHPLCGGRRRSRWRSVAIIVALWGCSALLSLPPLLYSRTRSYRYADGSVRTVCILVWPDGPLSASYADYV
ncbi:hypothetical protein HPB48_016307 [Haemaphysalis longicornis]|uniref:G-protein coupled receptors family 1 profile domain-containing protein n=1 Tax=Haemaphysalis longicornis TaxID=44386 RepID=A0A9J6FAX5_HAELO|nr:hypothetical protein HPB48_016307 [Haemaphysalis longicornis]